VLMEWSFPARNSNEKVNISHGCFAILRHVNYDSFAAT
jgi:hypothetical protein